MAEGFRWTRRGYHARLEPAEARLLRGLFKDVATLLTGRREDAADSSAAPAPEAAATDADDAFWSLVSGLSLGASSRQAPTDPALLRLLPPSFGSPAGAAEDPGRAAADARYDAEHRADAEDLLIDAKLADAQRARELLRSPELRLDEEAALSFSRALNDVRLVLSARLGITDEEAAARVHRVDDWKHAADEESAMALLYNFTSWFLESLMDQMLRGLPEDGREVVPGLEGPDAGEDRP